ncbi:RNA polymerase sigma factor [Chitinophaga tropicalis]|uniref:Sigma-70 family RNA polymerase sigma factor n=1 Tax=Chitinophaga tropicalis TaxID=2683588 RepID=A0A7K1U7N1_9BACT|nr:sigma-70 family RNA polymerase sigma factor [Chitinophaga tropicalis]MVT10350.1 sigma-70 family RNA polymerase sigma factor [Chitinophaga tropicalis]
MASQGTNEDLDEKKLFARVADGDEEAFNIIYHHFITLLGGAVFRIVKSERDMEEVLQEAFLRVWLNRDTIPGLTNPGGWIRRIVVNECYRLLKKKGLRERLHENLLSLAGENAISTHHTAQQVALNETRRIVQEAIAELSPRQYAIYKLSREQGKTTPEIARILGLTPDYVKKTLATALEKIRRKLKAAGKLLPSTLFFF